MVHGTFYVTLVLEYEIMKQYKGTFIMVQCHYTYIIHI